MTDSVSRTIKVSRKGTFEHSLDGSIVSSRQRDRRPREAQGKAQRCGSAGAHPEGEG